MSAKYPALRLEGGFLASELVDSIAEGSAVGQSARDFGLPDRTTLLDQISAVWSDARGFWTGFNRKAELLTEDDLGTTFTRNQWVCPLFGLLGYDLAYQEHGEEVAGVEYAISHRADRHSNAPPVHVVGVGQSLDRRAESGRPRLAPHSLLQEFLNRTELVLNCVNTYLY